MLELFYEGMCGTVLIGDVDVWEKDWEDIAALSQNYVQLRAKYVRNILLSETSFTTTGRIPAIWCSVPRNPGSTGSGYCRKESVNGPPAASTFQ